MWGNQIMSIQFGRVLVTLAGLCLASTSVQSASDSVDQHLTAAKKAAGLDFAGTLVRLCIAPAGFGGGGDGGERAIPDRATWYAEPAKVFDNLYFLGTKIHSAWALTTSDGIILIDTLYHYAVEDEIVGGMKKLGLDPAQVKYVLISHGHGDHDEGARLMQDRYGSRVVMGGPDWDGIEKLASKPGGKPKRDIVATDGQKITLGDTTVTLVSTPGHTEGTMSFIFTVKDNGKPMTVAYAGGTALRLIYQDPAKLNTYVETQDKFARMAAQEKATVLMTNHTEFDSAYIRARLMAVRKPGEAHPYEAGTNGVTRYFTVMAECAKAQIARLKAPNS
jgi:metallo-beta-lactamase class B